MRKKMDKFNEIFKKNDENNIIIETSGETFRFLNALFKKNTRNKQNRLPCTVLNNYRKTNDNGN